MEKFDFCDKHLENEVTATSSKSTPFKPIRRSLRQLMVRNENDYKISNTLKSTREDSN